MDRPRLLRTSVAGGSIRVTLDGWGFGHGTTVEAAVEALVAHLLQQALALRTSGFRIAPDAPRLNREYFDFLWRLSEIAVGGGDVRGFVFDAGTEPHSR